MRIVVAALLFVMFTLAGCTDDGGSMDGGGDSNGDTGGTGGGDGGGTGTAPETHDIAIEGFAFSPSSLTISVGDTVRWTNNDAATHTVDSTDGGPLDSGNIPSGATFEFTFDEAGTFAYRCDIHKSMTGSITVEA